MSARKIAAIHQPNFFPWLGYFNKLARADVFIFMDNVQFPKTGGTWINRVQILINGKASWITLPIVRAYHGTRKICDMEINDSIPWRKKMLKTIQSNYGRAPFFSNVFPVITELIMQKNDSLSDFNIRVVGELAGRISLDTSKLVLGSELAADGESTQLLVNMTKTVNGTAYLAGGGAKDYQENGMFSDAKLELISQNFQHPLYTQFNAPGFVPGLSIIDALMNCGFEHTGKLVSKLGAD